MQLTCVLFWLGRPMVLPEANIWLGALEKVKKSKDQNRPELLEKPGAHGHMFVKSHWPNVAQSPTNSYWPVPTSNPQIDTATCLNLFLYAGIFILIILIIFCKIWPVHLSLVIFDQSNLPPLNNFPATSNMNHFIFHNILTQTWLTWHDRVTCIWNDLDR